jgi:hypothetical protein
MLMPAFPTGDKFGGGDRVGAPDERERFGGGLNGNVAAGFVGGDCRIREYFGEEALHAVDFRFDHHAVPSGSLPRM